MFSNVFVRPRSDRGAPVRAGGLVAALTLASVLSGVVLSPSVAHAQMQPNVVGGKPAPEGAWPGVVGILYAGEPDNFWAQYCGGTLIGKRHVLTAAHCVDGSYVEDIEVLVGTQDLQSGGRRVAVKGYVMHPKYDPSIIDFDVAVIELARAVRDIEPVKFASSAAEETAAAPVGSKAMVVGWGLMEDSYPTVLMQAKLPIVDHGDCEAIYDELAYPITSRMLCAGSPRHTKASCYGDSGGPLWGKAEDGTYSVQVGVVSWGIPCAYAGYPDVFSRLAKLGKWVKAQMAD